MGGLTRLPRTAPVPRAKTMIVQNQSRLLIACTRTAVITGSNVSNGIMDEDRIYTRTPVDHSKYGIESKSHPGHDFATDTNGRSFTVDLLYGLTVTQLTSEEM